METILLYFWIAHANMGYHQPVQLFHSVNDACYESSLGIYTNVVAIRMIKRYDENSKIKILWTVNRINCKVSIEHKEE